MEETPNFGPHWIAEARGVDPSKIQDKELIEYFMRKAVEVARMHIILGPFVVYYNHPDTQESGVTGLLALADSHMSVHSFLNDGSIFFDLFSCKDFDALEISKLVLDTFSPKVYTYQVIHRGEGYARKEEKF